MFLIDFPFILSSNGTRTGPRRGWGLQWILAWSRPGLPRLDLWMSHSSCLPSLLAGGKQNYCIWQNSSVDSTEAGQCFTVRLFKTRGWNFSITTFRHDLCVSGYPRWHQDGSLLNSDTVRGLDPSAPRMLWSNVLFLVDRRRIPQQSKLCILYLLSRWDHWSSCLATLHRRSKWS